MWKGDVGKKPGAEEAESDSAEEEEEEANDGKEEKGKTHEEL